MKAIARHFLLPISYVTVALACTPLTLAIPPSGGGGSTTAGKIHYVAGNSTYSMNADGSGKQVASPMLTSRPLEAPLSARKYSGSRWQLIVQPSADTFVAYTDLNGNGQYDLESETLTSLPGQEVFAWRWIDGDWQVLQVTDTSRDGFRHFHYTSADVNVAWSNDGDDSFLSVRLTGCDLDADNRYVLTSSRPQYIARIRVSGADLDVSAGLGMHPLVRVADSRFEIVAEDPIATVQNFSETFVSHSWSPDGSRLVIGNSGTNLNPGATLYVWNVATGESQFLVHAGDDVGVHHAWSPNGSKIVVGDGGTILLVNSDGTGLTTLRSSSGTAYSYPCWSPDSKWIAYRKLNSTKSIAKIPASGGKEIILTKDLNGIQQWTLGWSKD